MVRRLVLPCLLAGVMALTACGSTDSSHEPDSTDGDSDNHAVEDDASGDGGSIEMILDGEPSPGWGSVLCSDIGTALLLSAAGDDGGDLSVQYPTSGGGLVVDLTLPGADTNLMFGEHSGENDGDTYMITGTVTDDPYEPTESHDVDITIECPAA